MRKVTLLSMFTGLLVGLKIVLVIVSAEWVICTATESRFVVPPPALATAELMAVAEAAIAVNETVMFVLRTTTSRQTLFHVNVPAASVYGAKLAATAPCWL